MIYFLWFIVGFISATALITTYSACVISGRISREEEKRNLEVEEYDGTTQHN